MSINRKQLSSIAKVDTTNMSHAQKLDAFAKALGYDSQAAMMAAARKAELEETSEIRTPAKTWKFRTADDLARLSRRDLQSVGEQVPAIADAMIEHDKMRANALKGNLWGLFGSIMTIGTLAAFLAYVALYGELGTVQPWGEPLTMNDAEIIGRWLFAILAIGICSIAVGLQYSRIGAQNLNRMTDAAARARSLIPKADTKEMAAAIEAVLWRSKPA